LDVFEAIKTRRSIRKYKADPIDDATLETILEAARWAPSWSNTQCWRFVVVKDSDIKNKLADVMIGLTSETPNPAEKAVREAPVVIVACAKMGRSGYSKQRPEPETDKGDWFMFDVALAMENISLAAHALGLGTVQIGAFHAEEATEILEIPEGYRIVAMTPLGYPDEEGHMVKRKELTDIVCQDKFTLEG
jgi:nitroreductase